MIEQEVVIPVILHGIATPASSGRARWEEEGGGLAGYGRVGGGFYWETRDLSHIVKQKSVGSNTVAVSSTSTPSSGLWCCVQGGGGGKHPITSLSPGSSYQTDTLLLPSSIVQTCSLIIERNIVSIRAETLKKLMYEQNMLYPFFLVTLSY